jgi:hypothetical protein
VKLSLGLATIASTFLALLTPQLGRSQNILPQPVPTRVSNPIDRQQQIFVPSVPTRAVGTVDRGVGVFYQPFPTNTYPTTKRDRPILIQNNGGVVNPSTTNIINPFAPIDPNSGAFPGAIDLIEFTNNAANGRYVPQQPAPVISPDRQLDPRGPRYACSNSIVGVPSVTPSAINRYTGQPCR